MTNLVAACLTDCTSEWLAVHSEWLNDSVVELLDHWPFLIDLITQHLSYSLKPQSCIRQLLYNFFYPLQKSLLRVLGSLKRQDKTGFTSYVEMENYFFFENIYLDRTKDFAKKINCSCHKKHSQMTTLRSFAHNLANQKIDFLSWPVIAFGFVNKRSGYKIISDCLVCCLCDWLSGGLTQCLTEWFTELLTLQLPCLLLM